MSSQKFMAVIGTVKKDGCDHDRQSTNSWDIHSDTSLWIGKDESCDIEINDDYISRKHLQIYSVIYETNIQPFVYARNVSMNGSYWIPRDDNTPRNAFEIGQDQAVLLTDGDKVRLSNRHTFTFSLEFSPEDGSSEVPNAQVDAVQGREIQSFATLFSVSERCLGSGGQGKVFMAIDRWHGRQVACKVVALRDFPNKRSQDEDLPLWRSDAANQRARCKSREAKIAAASWREVKLLRDISHPNVVRIERFFYSSENMYILEELVTGGDLLSYLLQIGRAEKSIDDTDACLIVFQILKALQYLHQNHIAHRDLKPENVLLSMPAVGARVIVTDFGQARKPTLSKHPRRRPLRMTTKCGTEDYTAPEVYGPKGYTIAADLWAVGKLTTTIFAGEPISFNGRPHLLPSHGKSSEATSENLLDVMRKEPKWQSVSPKAKALIRRLLVVDEIARLTVEQALEDPWFAEGERKEAVERLYQKATLGWLPRMPVFDFEEDLNELFKPQTLDAPVREQLLPIRGAKEISTSSPYFLYDQQSNGRDALGTSQVSRSGHGGAERPKKRKTDHPHVSMTEKGDRSEAVRGDDKSDNGRLAVESTTETRVSTTGTSKSRKTSDFDKEKDRRRISYYNKNGIRTARQLAATERSRGAG